jgi:hypothetical protein
MISENTACSKDLVLVSAAIGAATLVLYLGTLAPTFGWGDSADLAMRIDCFFGAVSVGLVGGAVFEMLLRSARSSTRSSVASARRCDERKRKGSAGD